MFLRSHHGDLELQFSIMQVSFMQRLDGFLWKIWCFIFYFPLNRLLVYEGSLYRLKCIVKRQMRKK